MYSIPALALGFYLRHTLHMQAKIIPILGVSIGVIILIVILVAVVIYNLPLRSSQLQSGNPKPMSYDQSITKIAALVKRESEQKVLLNCHSTLLSHGSKTAKTVVMFHGLTACPEQYSGLAKVFYDAGYNVYIPRAPYHGTADKHDPGNIIAHDLVDYANTSINIATGLGSELGVVGLSGGGLIATWTAEYRSEIQSALILSPFYEPAIAHAPKWQLQFLNVLYGYHILPDKFVDNDGTLFSYRALANYDILTKNLKKNPSNLSLKTLALITTPHDTQIDLDLAAKIPEGIADANKLTYLETSLPSDWGVEHDMVSPANPHVAAHQTQLFKLFFDSYEGRPTKL